MNNTYFLELTRQLNRARIQTVPTEQDRLPILRNGEAVIFVTLNAHTLIQEDYRTSTDLTDLYHQTAGIARHVYDYVTAVEQAPLLQADGLDNEFRLLAEFNDVVLAGRELPNGYGYEFVTWQ